MMIQGVKYLIAIVFMFCGVVAFAQQTERPLVQFSGMVYTSDSTQTAIPYVTVTNLSYNKQTNIANYKGYFSFVAHERDTLQFSCVGYAPKTVVIPSGVNKSYTTKISLTPQVINLPTFRVFPWATTDEFRKDFLSMKVADDDLEIARKNLAKGSIAELARTLPRDGREIQTQNAQAMHIGILNQHSLTPNPLLNPIAWGTLIKSITQGDKSRQGSN